MRETGKQVRHRCGRRDGFWFVVTFCDFLLLWPGKSWSAPRRDFPSRDHIASARLCRNGQAANTGDVRTAQLGSVIVRLSKECAYPTSLGMNFSSPISRTGLLLSTFRLPVLLIRLPRFCCYYCFFQHHYHTTTTCSTLCWIISVYTC